MRRDFSAHFFIKCSELDSCAPRLLPLRSKNPFFCIFRVSLYAPNADFDADSEYLISFSIDCTILPIFPNNRFGSAIFVAAYLLNRLSEIDFFIYSQSTL